MKSAPGRRRPDLSAYNAKRRFSLTSEPRGVAGGASQGCSFVVQEHQASHRHFDFRLELDGVLLSWAVPKGPSLSPHDKRLAMQTENHPIAYRDFEGVIPKGEYGGGQVIVWDRGSWQPEGDARAGLAQGELKFVLQGEKLRGGFVLVRTRGRLGKADAGPGSAWLLIKHADKFARSGSDAAVTSASPRSVLSGRLVGEIDSPADPPSVTSTKAKAVAKKPGKAMPALADIDLQLATLVDRPPQSGAWGEWIYEIKFDGYRMLASVDGSKVRLRSRNGLDWSKTFPHITRALQKLKLKSTLLDGELCAVDDEGRSSFQQLQNALPRGGGSVAEGAADRLVFQIFDLLGGDGVDWRSEPLLERKQRLQALLGSKPPRPLSYSDHVQGDGRTALVQACAAGLEGLIAKRPDAPYRGGRSRDWLKLKCQKRQEFVIVGMTQPAGARSGFGALLVGVAEDERWRYAGRVGSGFSEADLCSLKTRLGKGAIDKTPLIDPPKIRGITWVRPELVCEVEFTERTESGLLRHPVFHGLRLDKAATDVRTEKAMPISNIETPKKDGVQPRISHPDRIIDARSGVTKGELARYHQTVSSLLMPYAQNRPLALVRCPQGDAQACFFQKHAMRGMGNSVHKRRIDGQELLFVDEPRGVLELVQFNAIEFHAWGCTIDRIGQPDWIVMDLDPDVGLPFSRVVDAALQMRDTLAGLKLRSFVKTTGGKGLHVVLPLTPGADWKTVKAFAKAIAVSFAESAPECFVATMSKAQRKNKIFIDYLRNESGSTAVLPYSPRARPGATVAMPVDWKDLPHLDPQDYSVRSAPAWLAKRRRDPWAEFHDVKQAIPGNQR